MKKMISGILSIAMLLSAFPIGIPAWAEETDTPWFIENFDKSETVEGTIKNRENGWSHDGADGATVDISVGDYGNDGYSLRMSNGDNWFKNVWTGLDLGQNISSALIAEGMDQAEAEQEVAEKLSHDLELSFQTKFEIQGVSGGGHESYVRVKDADYNILTELHTEDDKLYVRALNEDKSQLLDYEIQEIDTAAHNNTWYDFKITYDFENTVCSITMNGTPITINGSTAIPVGTVEKPVTQLTSVASMEYGLFWSGWWHCLYVDDVAVNPVTKPEETTPPAETTAPGTVVYSEDFETPGLIDTVMAKQEGWSYDSEDANEFLDIEISDKENTSNGLRFSSKDYWKSMWLDLDLNANGVAKQMAQGVPEADAQAAVDKYLSENMRISFRAKLDIDGVSDNPENIHESYIKIKNGETATITELHTKQDMLYLKGLGDQEYYPIKQINITKENTDYHTFQIDYNMEANTYRLTVDGEEFAVNGNKDFKAGAGEGEKTIGSVGTLELGHFWSGWWQRLVFDDLTIEKLGAPSDQTPPPSSSPTVAPTPEAGVNYLETFDESGIETQIKDQQNGWSYTGASQQEQFASPSVGNNGGGFGKSLKFTSMDWYKNVWLVLDFNQNGVYKKMQEGMTEPEAQAAVSDYLGKDMKLSFRAKFEKRGNDTQFTHEQYIRVKGPDGHVITEIHLYDNMLKLVALNENQTANEAYEVKNINWNDGANDWHNFAIYYSFEKNAYQFEMDGQIFRGTPHGRWIPAGNGTDVGSSVPAPIDSISSLEIGHFWGAFEASMCLDNLQIAEFTPGEDVFEITNVFIRNEQNNSVLTPGDRVHAVVNTAGGTLQSKEEVWSWSADGGRTWTALTGNIIPETANRIKVTVTAYNAEGDTDEFTKEQVVDPPGSIIYENLVTETFEGANKEKEINDRVNGWEISGSSVQAKVGSGFGSGSGNALRFAATTNNITTNLRLNFMERGASYQQGDNVRLKFSYAFGLDSDEAAIVSTAGAYVRVKAEDGTAFTAISLLGDTMKFVYYDDALGKNQEMVIATGKANVIDKWRNVEIYLDTARNKYCVSIDGQMIGKENQKWFTPSDSIVPGIGKPIQVSGIGMLDVGQENSAWWSNTKLDNVYLDKYYVPASNKFRVSDITVTNAYSDQQPIACGTAVKAAPVADRASGIKENTMITDCAYAWTYKNASGTEKTMDNGVIPYDAVSVKVEGTFQNAVGQETIFEKEIPVQSNTAPVISNLTVAGAFKTGSSLKVEYQFQDAEASDQDNTKISWYRANAIDGEYELITENAKEYTVKAADMSRFLKIVAVPVDSYGAMGAAVEKIMSAEILSDFDAAWKRVNIDTNPSDNETQIDLPLKDKETGITFSWSSSKPSVISNSGQITRPAQYTVVILTGTAAKPDGTTDPNGPRTYSIALQGRSTPKPSYGGGGGGGGGGTRIPTPTAGPVPTADPSTPDGGEEQEPGGNTQGFVDVAADAWYAGYVASLAANDVVAGDESGRFRPEDTITRSEFLKMVIEVFELQDESAQCTFGDVPTDSWAYPYIASAVKFDIAKGGADGTFRPNDKITREDMAVIAARAAELLDILPEGGELSFTDAGDVADYARDSVAKMEKAEILSGFDGVFDPKGNATRAQAAKVICMLMELLER